MSSQPLRIACCIDFSPFSRPILAEAVSLARALDATLDVFHVVPTEEPLTSGGVAPPGTHPVPAVDMAERHRMMETELAHLRALGVRVEGHLLVSESAAEAVLEQVESLGISRLVVGSHGRAMVFELLVGSFTQAILRKAKVPVLVVPIPREE